MRWVVWVDGLKQVKANVDFYFNNFKFDSESLLLTQQGEPIAIRNNEAKLLAFLLANPGQVFSKDAILENVWTGKVVSEQAVFQAISNLRNLFGEDAIKTFPKKGYQWQIPLLSGELPSVEKLTSAVPKSSHLPWAFAVLCVLGVVAVAVLFVARPAAKHESIPILLAPFATELKTEATRELASSVQNAFLKQTENLAVQLTPSIDSPKNIVAAPDYFLNRYQQSSEAKLLVTGVIGQQNKNVYLSLVLQGRNNQWRAYVTGKNPEEVARTLHKLLNKVGAKNVFWEASDWRLINAQLQILHKENPEDLIIHYQLVENLLFLGDTNSAKIQAEELELQSHASGNVPYESLALLMQMLASNQSAPIEKQLALLDKAVALAAGINDRVLQSRIMEYYTYIYYTQNNFAALEDNLLRALALAESSPEQQLQILHVLSIFSYKLKHEDKRDEYLAQARILLDKYQFPDERYAQLDDIAGVYTRDKTQKEFFYRAALNRYKPEQSTGIKESAQRHLIELYMDDERWDDAFAILATENNLSGAELVMRARIYFKKNEMTQAQAQAEAAFKQANSQGEYYASLNAALLLAQIYQKTGKPDLQKNMREFIDKNASEAWKNDKRDQLKDI